MNLEILYNKGKGKSSTCHLNYVAKSDKLFIMDNHLAAIWCWEQLDRIKKYSLLHIDAHYDLGGVPFEHDFYHRLDLTQMPVEALMSVKSAYFQSENVPFFLWDNYIHLFADKFPSLINRYIFMTQKAGDFYPIDEDTEEKDIWHLKYMFQEFYPENWLLNLDIDYFVEAVNGTYKQIFTDDYIRDIGAWIKTHYSKFHQIIIALSPDCCGGWEQSLRIANLLLEPLEIRIDI